MPNWPTDKDFAHLFAQMGATRLAERVGTDERNVYRRRRRIEKTLGQHIPSPTTNPPERNARINVSLPKDCHVLIGSDAHYWPGPPSTAHLAFVHFAAEYKPAVIIMNGDALDAATISRHPPIGWENAPTLKEELEACQERLGDIEAEKGKRTRLIWTLGNHDARFETKAAACMPEMRGVNGVHLKDHFPAWEPCWSVFLNDDCVVKHRFKGGIHAPHNNTLWAGRSIITGHLHSQKVSPVDDYGGTRWGVDTGCLADPLGPQFEYLEDNPVNWRSGFCLLTYEDGHLLTPELVRVVSPNRYEWRGKTYGV